MKKLIIALALFAPVVATAANLPVNLECKSVEGNKIIEIHRPDSYPSFLYVNGTKMQIREVLQGLNPKDKMYLYSKTDSSEGYSFQPTQSGKVSLLAGSGDYFNCDAA
ncbi:hypothetical protein L9F34_000315 [Klebsiella aerogenes]|uniref:hypothetical protein n=1 Tax=Klebsiella TaxID=570 RepID=UPI000390113E|nr:MULTISPECIES: hypothetical protein [Klebsiella]EKV3390535.1 hypothetical protein [Klebsiella aerogenes]EMF0746000.1 hypothetical protein [Klebsiella aerogenes]MBC5182675.1 hypothetical protein [Klebsiella quasipneumoniae]MCA4034454.1 hypothetical protein [Klebsiella quasipneumoniae]MCW9408708.1 hypothetical protein [Klebsiella quasipneumoniae]